ncbi:MAG: MFS transporter [Acidimicrobiia bacterium]
MGADAREPNPRTLNVDSVGVDELGVVPWPILLRGRIARRVGVRRETAVLWIVLTSLFMVSVTFTILTLSLGRIASDLNTSTGVIAWSITGPMLAFGVVGPVYGKAGDLWGHKRVFVLGMLGAGVFAGLTAVAWNGFTMVLFRVLSSSCGAATGPATMAYINRMFGTDERVRPLGYWSFVNAGAPVVGVIAGAPLVEHLGWRIIFIVQAPLLIVGTVIALWLLPDTERLSDVRFDVKGSLTLGLGAAALLAGVNQGPKWGWTSPAVLVLIVGALVILRFFIGIERRAIDPLLPLHWLRSRAVVVPVMAQSMANFAYMGGSLLAPQVMENVLDYSSGRMSLVTIARPLVFAVLAPLGSLVTVRVGERSMGVAGTTMMMMSMMMFSFIGQSTGTYHVVLSMALSGAAFGLLGPSMVSLVANGVDDKDLGVAGALQQLMSQMGAVFGSVIMVTVQQATENGDPTPSSYANAFRVAAGVSIAAVLVAARVRSTPR